MSNDTPNICKKKRRGKKIKVMITVFDKVKFRVKCSIQDIERYLKVLKKII